MSELHDEIGIEFKPEDSNGFTYNELMAFHNKNLEGVRNQLRKELQVLQQDKMILCANILSLQGLIKQEKER